MYIKNISYIAVAAVNYLKIIINYILGEQY